MSKNTKYSILILISTIIIMFIAAMYFLSQHQKEPIVKGPGVTKVEKLSKYFAGIKDSPGDTDVYFLEGEKPGGTVFLFGGCHNNEPAGLISAVLLIENAIVKEGRLIVIPRVNESGATHTDPSDGVPSRFHIKTEWGSRWFRFGSRLTNPIHQWPDPEVYVHYPSGQKLSDIDARDLNRAYPGRANGLFIQKVAFAIVELVRKENIDLTIDLHEARPMSPIVNVIVAPEKSQSIAALATIDLELEGVKIRLEPSPEKMRGISHRELADHTETIPMLMETPNPIMDKLHGRADEALILTGKDEFFLKAYSKGLLFVPYDKNGLPLEMRVGRHVTSFLKITNIFSDFNPDKKIVIENLPDFTTIQEKGVGYFLLEPKE
jgi:hypothetical protein